MKDPAAFNIKLFMTLVNDMQLLSNVTNNSILDIATILDTLWQLLFFPCVYFQVRKVLISSNKL